MSTKKKAKPRVYSYLRFSTPEQAEGDSERRQIELAEKWAKARSLTLDESLRMTDEGLSAYKGNHRTQGALGEFIAQVKAGTVPKGSTLLVESLDRLSREQILSALNQFTELIQPGAKIVTLADGMEYDVKSINANVGQLIVSLTIMSRAHEESQMKAQRLSAAWADKRKKIEDRPLTGRCPAWLVPTRDEKGKATGFKQDKRAVAAVRRIYRMRARGIGAEKIAMTLNADKRVWQPPRGNGWRKSYVQKILSNHAVIGEYQPHRMVPDEARASGTRREPVGDPVPDYFPSIVNKDLFYQVQQLNKLNATNYHGGRNGSVGNLFGHIAKCGYCGAPMTYRNHGAGSTRLICDNERRGLPCRPTAKEHAAEQGRVLNRSGVIYESFERLVLDYCRGLKIEDVQSPDQRRQDELELAQSDLDAAWGELANAEKEMENILKAVDQAKSDSYRAKLEEKFLQKEARAKQLEQKAKDAEERVRRASQADENAQEHIDGVRELLERAERAGGEIRREVRTRVRARLRRLLEKVYVFAGGPRPLYLRDHPEAKELKALIDEAISREDDAKEWPRKRREGGTFAEVVLVRFADGAVRVLAPRRREVLALETEP